MTIPKINYRIEGDKYELLIDNWISYQNEFFLSETDLVKLLPISYKTYENIRLKKSFVSRRTMKVLKEANLLLEEKF
jgi:hypothetical protein